AAVATNVRPRILRLPHSESTTFFVFLRLSPRRVIRCAVSVRAHYRDFLSARNQYLSQTFPFAAFHSKSPPYTFFCTELSTDEAKAEIWQASRKRFRYNFLPENRTPVAGALAEYSSQSPDLRF
ncbi:hypothetical protein ACLECX_16480, partial [Lonsdalea quercina]|uniref:hypothetical protein n=2 Tax=Lonsdalea quercina TaxID=71657 RepID=UPI0039768815